MQHQTGHSTPGENTPLLKTFGRLAPQLKPILPRLLLGFLCALAAGVVALTIPQVLRGLVNSVLHAGGASTEVWIAAGVVAGLGLLEAVLVYLRRVFVITPAARIETQLRVRLYRHLQDLPVAFHDKWGSGQLLSRSMADLGLIRRWLAFGSIMLVVATVTVVVGLVLMFSSNWLLGTIYLAGAIPITIRAFYFRNVFRAASRLSQDQAGDLATTVEESVHGIRVLKAFGRGRHALEGFSVQAERLRDTEISKARSLSGFLMFVVSVPEITLGIGLFVGVWLTARGELTVGEVVAFFATAAVLAGPVEGIGMLLGMTLTTKTALDRHYDVMDTPNTITSPAAAEAPASPRGHLELRGLSFRFPDAKPGSTPVLDGVDLEILPGETMALVGTTGSGKSTLLQLVPRLYEATGGQILLDGVDVRRYDVEALRTAIAVAFEDTTLFSSSIRDNVLLGARPSPGQSPDDALAEALETAQAGFVHSLPDGVDTLIGEEGLSLSGGQRQRIALARAIAAKPRLLVLDDPLSALDVKTEEAVTERLREVLARTSTLIVAHRPSTVMLADRVALLDGGRIIDVGTHAELLRRSDHYRHVIASLDEPPSVEEVLDAGEEKR
ncbi:ABC transporter ATP-binding protein [Zafaria sp. J156]|uniref:ABC transporter ATP-binding protein n=1 Tax=Zafaria sp. J156 TaxID=3116490 RepID=UPI002E7854B0|nr:ABC transporter ATP-binding protein [Zafaria sp. J156]MEE1621368.1 ABC transporter ATP-binding protein [Zafaria sp. J156]